MSVLNNQSIQRRTKLFKQYYSAVLCALLLFLSLLLLSSPIQADQHYPANPTIANNSVFIAGRSVSRFDSQTLQASWHALPEIFSDAPVVSPTALLVGSSSGLFALDLNNGAQLWHLAPSERIYSPALADGVAYAGSEHGLLRAISIADGELIWQRQFDGWVYAPAISNERLVVGGKAARLYALARDTGRLLWTHALAQELVFRPIISSRGDVIVTLFSGEILALSAVDAELRWRVTDKVANLSPVSADGKLYFRTFSGTLKVRSADDGRVLWQHQNHLSQHPVQVIKQRVIVRDNHTGIAILDAADGRLLWQHNALAEPIGSPILLANRLVLFTDGPDVRTQLTVLQWSITQP